MPRRPAKPATAAYLERVAVHYLERHPGTEARLRRVLGLRVRRSVEELGTDPAEGAAAIEVVVRRLAQLGYVDDERFAASRLRTLRRRGKSKRAIAATLRHQGVPQEIVEATLAADTTDELDAARAFARRRRLGAHRPEEVRRDRHQRDLASLARAGFSYDVARRALEAVEDDEG